jgi:signal transduction histidine kinase
MMVRVEVEDSGPGVAEEIRRRLFGTITTTKGIGEGTGLGLAVCHFIVRELHGGEIEIEPERQHGTRIVVRLPVARLSS